MRPDPSHSVTPRLLTGALLLAAGLAAGAAAGTWWAGRDVLPSRATVEIEEAGLPFVARLDTGATVSSINAHDLDVIDGGMAPSRDDTGRMIRFALVNHAGERRELTARIEEVRGVRTADCRELRYHVYLTVRFRGRSYRVLTNLNDRSRSEDKMLLGRNWLRYGFAVDPLKSTRL